MTDSEIGNIANVEFRIMRVAMNIVNQRLQQRLGSERGRIDARLVEACDSERQYWSNVLSRIVAVVKFLAERGLPFRVHDEIIGSPTNGNYLGVLEIISQFDPFLAQHIEQQVARDGKLAIQWCSPNSNIALLASYF